MVPLFLGRLTNVLLYTCIISQDNSIYLLEVMSVSGIYRRIKYSRNKVGNKPENVMTQWANLFILCVELSIYILGSTGKHFIGSYINVNVVLNSLKTWASVELLNVVDSK